MRNRKRVDTVETFIALFVSLMMLTLVFSTTSTAGDSEQGVESSRTVHPATPPLNTITFPPGTFVLPMDSKQPDLAQAFGFVHALLRNGSFIYRLIEPPDVKIRTNYSVSGTVYSGGPILILSGSSGVISLVLPAFPMVILHITCSSLTSDRVFIVREPTKILWMNGGAGGTDSLLREMKIPYTTCSDTALKNNPGIVWNYTLLIDDCLGMLGVPEKVARVFRTFTVRGNEIIFTCWALTDFKQTFLNYINGDITTSPFSRASGITAVSDFPGQYAGPSIVTFNQIWTKAYIVQTNVSIIAKGTQWLDAAYINYGKGIAEFFSFHPGEQTGAAKRAAITLYGNKFIHFTSSGDSTVVSTMTASPRIIARKGTSDIKSEQCTVSVSAKSSGFSVTPANTLVVNCKLKPYIDNVSNSFTDPKGNPLPPDSIVVNPDLMKSLRWDIHWLNASNEWKVFFKITSNSSGNETCITDSGASNITFIDDQGLMRIYHFPELTIDVIDGYVVPEIPILEILFIVFLPACVVVERISLSRHRRSGQ